MSDSKAAAAAAPSTADSSSSKPNLGEWLLSSAICVERAPTLTPKLTDFQIEMMKNLDQMNLENSLKSDHEIRHDRDLENAAKRKDGEQIEAGERTAVDDQDEWEKEFAAFTPVPRKTEADEKCDVRSIRRALDRPLHLIAQRKIGDALHWDLPTAINVREGGESMRETAERALFSHFGDGLKVSVLGNAPWTFYKYNYPRKIREQTGKRGEKVFIYKAFLESGANSIAMDQKLCNDYKWVLREELWDALDHNTRRALFDVLYNEE